MEMATDSQSLRGKRRKKRVYVKPDIKEVWNENIGMTGVYLLEM